MKIEELLIEGKKHFHKTQVKMLLADVLNKNPLELNLYLDEEVDKSKEVLFLKKLESLKKNEPLQYIIGNVDFLGNKFEVNNNVLIPRFETELLVQETIKLIDKHLKTDLNIIDLGTGSGVLGISLKKNYSNSKVTLVDISKNALEVAKKNALLNEVEVDFIESDFFEKINSKYNVVISNPPYIKTTEEVDELVLNNEPHLALYAGIDGLDCYKKILENVVDYLEKEFIIAFEIGYSQKNDVVALIKEHISECLIITKQDFTGKDRMIFVIKSLNN